MHRITIATSVVLPVFLTVAALLLTTAALLLTAGGSLASPRYAPETLIAGGPSAQNAPQCADGIEAWQDDAGDWNVWTGWQPAWAMVEAGASAQRHPAVSGQVIAFEDDRSGDWDIYAWDASNPADPVSETPVATRPGDQLDPAVGGIVVVYEDYSRGNADIRLYDLVNEKTWWLTSNASSQVDPATDGRWVVWADHRNGNWDIYSYDLQTGRYKRLTRNVAAQQAPQVGQGKVVYQDHRNGNWDIYEYVLASGKELRLTTSKADQTLPQIDPWPVGSHTGNIVYVDDRRDKGDIWVREGRTGVSKPVCTESGTQTAPGFAAEHVIWADARDGQPDVYGSDLSFPTLTVPRQITCDYGASVRLNGSFDDVNVGGQRVRIVGSGVDRTATVKRGITGEGPFSLHFYAVRRKLKLRVWFPGSAGNLPASGGTVTIRPRAELSTPWFARTPGNVVNGIREHMDRCTIKGTITPRHAAGSRPVALYLYRKVKYNPDWRLYKTLRPKVNNAGTVSSYRVDLDLSTWWSWTVQAVHEDGGHAKTESVFSRVIRER